MNKDFSKYINALYNIFKDSEVKRAIYGDLKSFNGASALHYSTTFDNNRVFKLLIENGFDLNSVDENGNTALHWLCSGSSAKMFDSCVGFFKNSDSLNKKNKQGAVPLKLACCFKSAKDLERLINLGADVNEKGIISSVLEYDYDQGSKLLTLIKCGAKIDDSLKMDECFYLTEVLNDSQQVELIALLERSLFNSSNIGKSIKTNTKSKKI